MNTLAGSRPLVLLLAVLTAFAPLSTDMYLSSLPSIGRELGVDTAATQGTMAIFLAGLAFGQFVYGPLSDRIGRRPPILIGLIIYLLASVICATATSLPVLLAGRFMQALGCSAGVVIASAVVGDLFDSTQTAKVMTSLIMVMGLAPILAPAIGATILLAGGWRTIFWVLATLAALVLLRCYFALRESRSQATALQAANEHPLRSYLLLLKNPRFLGYLLTAALASGMLFAYLAGSPALLIQVFGFSPQAYSGLVAINAVGVIGGAVLSGTLVTKFGVDRLLARTSVLATGLALLLFFAAATGVGGQWGILIMLFLTLSTFGVIASNATAGALSTDPLRSGSISALMNGSPFVSAGVTSWLTGLLFDHTARPMAGVMLGCIAAATAALWLLILRRRTTVA